MPNGYLTGRRAAALLTIIAVLVGGALLLAYAGVPGAEAQSPPATPSSVSLTRADGTVTASWPAVSGATKYHVTYSSDNKQSWSAASDSHTGTSITISGADNAKTYIVGVRAGNDSGQWSGWRNSDAIGPYTPPTPDPDPPSAPSSVTVTRGDGTVTADWPDVSGATKYHVTYSTDNKQSWSLAASSHPNSAITINNADNAKTYIVGVRAGNDAGWSGWRNSPPAGPYAPEPTPTPTPTPTEPPDSPTQVTVTRGDGSMTITWPAVDGASGYTVLASSVRNTQWYTKSQNQQGTSLTVTGLQNSRAYHAAVRAENSAGESEYRVSAAAAPYSAHSGDRPESVTLTRSHKKLTAKWQSGWQATSYHVTYTSDGGQSWSLAALNHPVGKGYTVIEIPDADNAKTYTVGVRGRNKHGDSGWRNSNAIGPLNIRLAVSDIAPTTATITLSNHDGDWHYKANAAPDDSCSAAQSSATVNLTGLSSGTTYTYAAYADAACSNLMATAAAFTTGSVVTVGNLNKTTGAYAYQVGRVHEPHMKAMVRHSTHFTTGGNSDGYTLNQATVILGAPHGSPTGLTAKIYSGIVASDGKNLPNAMVKSLGQQTPTSNGEVTWSCSDSGTGCDLSANTTYHLVLEGAAPASGDHHYTWATAHSYAQVNEPADAGWLISNRGFRQDDDGAWGGGGHIPGKLSVTATPK